MTTAKQEPHSFAPDSPKELADLVETVETLHRENTVAFIAAGDEKIYAYGGRGYTAVISEAVFGGLVEVQTPKGAIRVEPDADGRICATADGGAPLPELLADAARGLRSYYKLRYWKV
jgi:precorrin-3B methylase